jgi:hypothetical protein
MLPGRLTADELAKIIDWDADTWPDLDEFIDPANELVTECCVTRVATGGLTPYTDHRLLLIEKYLSAHFYHISDQRSASETVTGVGQMFQYKLGLGLDVTTYGQQVKRLDTYGFLASLDSVANDVKLPRAAGIMYLGTPPCTTSSDDQGCQED